MGKSLRGKRLKRLGLFWMGAGINYEYNPVRRKMEPQFLVYPVFKSGRFKIGM